MEYIYAYGVDIV